MRLRLALSCGLLLAASCTVFPSGGQPLDTAHFSQTGGGISVAAPGALELEADYDNDPGEALSTAIGLVYGLPHRWELGVAWTPYDVLRRPGPDSRGSGEVAFAAKHLLIEATPRNSGLSLEFGTHLDTAEAGHLERSGEADLFLALANAQSVGKFTWTLAYELAIPDDPDGSSILPEHVGALQLATEPESGLVVYAEAIAALAPAADSSAGYLGTGLAWSVSERWTLEAGALLGLGGDAEDFRLLLGFSTLLGNFGQ